MQIRLEDMIEAILTIDGIARCPVSKCPQNLRPSAKNNTVWCRMCWMQLATPTEIKQRWEELKGSEGKDE